MIPVAIGGLIGLYLLFHRVHPAAAQTAQFQRQDSGSHSNAQPRYDALHVQRAPAIDRKRNHSAQSRRCPAKYRHPAGKDRSSPFESGRLLSRLLDGRGKLPTATLHLTDEQTTRAARPGDVVESLELNVSKVLKKAASNDPHPLTHGAGNQPFRWKPALIVWFGPILTITCLYILALHFGWM